MSLAIFGDKRKLSQKGLADIDRSALECDLLVFYNNLKTFLNLKHVSYVIVGFFPSNPDFH